ncbi:MAG: prepilin-type N-terminal cleavage/methylation domain-containing protein [Akkermansiaceae bacterium]|nr:prepilin-type N-terminal cleavage/methylation domain-containing protein [Verrucomicrobiales bacterium]
MKELSAQGASKAFTLIEVLVVLAVVMMLGALVTPVIDRPGRAVTARCLGNLRQIEIGYVMFLSDHHEKFPWQLSSDQGGTYEVSANGPAAQFQVLATYTSKPEVFHCPGDTARHPAASYDVLNNTNISYFVNIDAVITNAPSITILLGDRNLRANGRPVNTGLFNLATNLNVSWAAPVHPQGGSLGFADGHAESVPNAKLKAIVQRQPTATSRLLIP